MENRTLEDLRQGLLDGTLRIRHNGIDIFIDCMETKDMLVRWTCHGMGNGSRGTKR